MHRTLKHLCSLGALMLGALVALLACTTPTEAPAGESPPLVTPQALQASRPIAPTATAPLPSPAPTLTVPSPGPAWPPAALQVQAAFAQEFGFAPEQVRIAAVEPMQWENDCLGAPLPGEACGNGPLSGYRVTLRVADEDYVYHVDESGRLIRPATPPSAPQEGPLLLWTREDPSGCTMALVGPNEVQFGPCSGPALHRPLSKAEKEALQTFVARYGAFESSTEGGFVQLTGQGAAQPSPEEALHMANWAKTVAQMSPSP